MSKLDNALETIRWHMERLMRDNGDDAEAVYELNDAFDVLEAELRALAKARGEE